jgi:hypothetical protein
MNWYSTKLELAIPPLTVAGEGRGGREASDTAACCGTMRYICQAASAVDWVREGWEEWGARTRDWGGRGFGMTTGRTENHGWQLWVHTTLGWNRGQARRWGKRVTQYVTCPASRSRGQFIRYIKKISSAEAIWPKEKEIRFMGHCRLSCDYVRLDLCILWLLLTLPALVSKIVPERGTGRKYSLCPLSSETESVRKNEKSTSCLQKITHSLKARY